jgi:hypothetical protein
MSGLRTLALCCFATAAVSVGAQSLPPRPPTMSEAAFTSFERVVATLNKPVAELSRIWPAPLTGGRTLTDLKLSAVHTLHVYITADPERRPDTTQRVYSALLREQFEDSLSFRQRTLELLTDFTKKFGMPDECSLPMGPPAYLHAAQNPARIWQKGMHGSRTVIDWVVSTDRTYVLTVYVGRLADTLGFTVPCAAPMP